MATGGVNLSKEFFDLLKAIGESKSKQEEDRIIMKEVTKLKQKLETPQGVTGGGGGLPNPLMSSKKRAKEFLVRLLYVEMLGHDGSFGYIKAVEMAASASLYHKRTGYLVCGACLSPDHEFRFMLVNQMQRDLHSSNVLEICGGILATTSLITEDMVPAVAGDVSKLIAHDSETVRKKAIIALHRFHQLAPETVSQQDMIEKIRKTLCDKDPAVMGSTLNVILSMAMQDAMPFKELIPSLVSILKQIGEHRLPSDFDYHRVPAPWIQMNLIRVLGVLGKADASASSGMYEILLDSMSKADVGVNAGYAVVYECLKTIAVIYPNPKLLDAAGEAISRFISSRSHNLKYLGVTGLAMIVESHPQYAAQHQLAVMDCLEDADETLQRKTLDLLYRMTNPVNVEFITERMLDFLRKTTDMFLKRVLTARVCSVAERYAPSNAWYIQTITTLFEVCGDMVKPEVAQNLMTLIAEGTGDSEEEDMLLRQSAIELYVGLLTEKKHRAVKLPRILLETMAWCLGEYGYLSAVCDLDTVLRSLCELARSKSSLHVSTRKFLLGAIMKLVAQAGNCPPHAAAVIDDYTRSKDIDLQQRCLEFQALLTTAPQILGLVLPVDASAEDVEMDPNLSFLNGYVSQAMANGASEYAKPEDDDDDDYLGDMPSAGGSGFKMTPYEKPQTPAYVNSSMRGIGSGGANVPSLPGVPLPPGAANAYEPRGPPPVHASATTGNSGQLTLNTRNVANVWGKPSGQSPVAAPAPAPAAVPTHNAFSAGSYPGAGSSFASSVPAPAAEPVQKTKEQLEKERMAAMLFGGVVPGAAPPPRAPAPVASPPKMAPTAPKPVATPPPAPPPAPEIDLLDMSMWDTPVAAPAAPVPADVDILTPSPVEPASTTAATPAVAAAPPQVETISDDEDGVEDVTPTPAAPPSQQPEPVDPFAAEGLLSGLTDAPLPSMEVSQKFEYNGTPMLPLQMTTAQFGPQWGTCTAVANVSTATTKVSSLQDFMNLGEKIGAFKVEAIAATNEGILAGMFNSGAQVVLLHGKVSPTGMGSANLVITIKSTDPGLSSSLALYLQTMAR